MALLAGCGSGSKRADPACTSQATKVADHGRSILLHYAGGTVYPADVGLLMLKGSLQQYARRGCPQKPLGEVLTRRLDDQQRTKLLALLPRPTARTIRSALSSVR